MNTKLLIKMSKLVENVVNSFSILKKTLLSTNKQVKLEICSYLLCKVNLRRRGDKFIWNPNKNINLLPFGLLGNFDIDADEKRGKPVSMEKNSQNEPIFPY
jgi:hypothetical protein